MTRIICYDSGRFLAERIVNNTICELLVNLLNNGYYLSYQNRQEFCLVSQYSDDSKWVLEFI